MADDVVEAAIGTNAQTVAVAADGRRAGAGVEVGRGPEMAHFADGGAADGAVVGFVARGEGGEVEGDVFAEIVGGGEQAAHGAEDTVGKGLLLFERAVGLEAVADGAGGFGHLREFERGVGHAEFGEDLLLHVLFVGLTGGFGDDAAEEAEGVVGVLVAGVGGGGEGDAGAEPFVEVGVAGAELLVAPGVVFGEAGGVAHEISDAEGGGVAGGEFHTGEFGDPLGDGVFEGELAFVAEFENGEGGEALGH